MALGKAIVAPDQPNIREILSPGSSALLFEPGAEESMGKAVLQLASNEVLRDRLGRAARSLISARDLTWKRNSERVTALGAALVAALGRRPLVAQ
jgi:glycosyltransferase involved in cell wall biosynthesis